jgi:hypothetical protein
MQRRMLPLGLSLCLAGCTLVVDDKIEKKPKTALVHEGDDAGGSEMDDDAGTDGGAGIDASDLHDAAADAQIDSASGGGDATSPGPDTGGGSGPGTIKLSLGDNHACGIDANGNLRCWGASAENQTKLPTDRTYKDVACGDYHSCGIDANGALVCAGRNRDGQRASDNGPFVQVTAGDAHTCVLDAAGKAKCWGLDDQGQATPPSDAFSSLGAGGGFTCGIRKADATVVCWGNTSQTLTTQVKDKKFLSIDAAPDYVCGVTEAHEGMCWTNSTYKPPALGEVTQIAAGKYSGCALLADSTVRCWYGGSTDLIGMDHAPFEFVAVGGTGRCAIPKSGSVYCEPEDGSAFAPGPGDFP